MKKSEVNILIVDDDESIRKVLGEALQRAGFRTVLVGRAEEAIAAVKIKPIYAALIDCMLPKKNGVDLSLELRNNGMEKTPIVLMSGIYRDKAFAAEAIRKVGAIDFLHKPIDINKLTELFEAELANLVDAPKLALHTLLAKPYSSQRDRRKALDHVEEAVGFDLPLILCILMDAESSGHLNIVNGNEEIFGISLVKGKVTKVDSSQSLSGLSLALIDKGFISATELQEFQAMNRKGDFLDGLIEANLVSPHAALTIRKEQMQSELKRLMTDEKIRINFVLDRKAKEESVFLNMEEFETLAHEVLEVSIPLEWFNKFYESWLFHPIRRGPNFSDSHPTVTMPVISRVSGLLAALKEEPTLEELLAKNLATPIEVYRAIHFLAMRRLIVFDEQRKVTNFSEYDERLRHIYKSIKDKDPIEIFNYFGARGDARSHEVIRIYKDFAKANHPDTLPANVPEELRKLNHDVFSLVTNAHEILSDDARRAEFLDRRRQKEAEVQIKAEQLVEEGANMLRLGKIAEAITALEEADKKFRTENGMLYLMWARMKAAKEGMPAHQVAEMQDFLNQVKSENRRTPLYVFVLGLFRKLQGERQGAVDCFVKVLEMDPRHLDARRELQAIRQESAKPDNGDLLTGDISVVIKNFFKKTK